MTSQMVRSDTGEIVDPYHQMDKMDEDLILAEIKGAALDKLVFVSGNIKMLSLAGVREAVRRLNSGGQARIRVSDREPIVTENDEYVEVRVYAEDVMNGGGSWGFKRQDKKTARGFALEMALSKAQRNALRSLIPEQWVVEMITTFLDQQRGGQRPQMQEPPRRQMPPPKAIYKQEQPEPEAPPAELLSMEDALGHKLLERARLSASKMQSHEPAGDKVTQHIAGQLFESLGDEADCDLLVKAIFGNGLKGLRAEQASFLDKWAAHQDFKRQAAAALAVAKAENTQAAS